MPGTSSKIEAIIAVVTVSLPAQCAPRPPSSELKNDTSVAQMKTFTWRASNSRRTNWPMAAARKTGPVPAQSTFSSRPNAAHARPTATAMTHAEWRGVLVASRVEFRAGLVRRSILPFQAPGRRCQSSWSSRWFTPRCPTSRIRVMPFGPMPMVTASDA